MLDITPSKIKLLFKCERQLLLYNEVGPMPPGGGLILGSGFHKALNHNYIQKMETYEDLPVKQVVEFFANDFEGRVPEVKWWPDEKPDTFKEKGVKIIGAYQKAIASKTQPSAVEKKWEIEVESPPTKLLEEETEEERDARSFKIHGRLDLITDKGIVVETKTSGAYIKTIQPEDAMQLSLYLISQAKEQGRVDYALTKNGEIRPLPYTMVDRDWQLWAISEKLKQVRAGIYPPRPTGWWCSERYCGWWNYCKGGKK